MLHVRFVSSVFFAVLFSLMTYCINAQAQSYDNDNTQTVQEETIQIVTPTPAPKETVTVPEGYAGCFTVAAGWYQNVWYPEHRVCQYNQEQVKTAQGSAWVDGHWACTKYTTTGQCTNWSWSPGHWVKTFSVY